MLISLEMMRKCLQAPQYEALKWFIQTGCKGAIWLAERI